METNNNNFGIDDMVQLRDLEGEEYTLIQQDQDLAAVLEEVPAAKLKEHQLFDGDTFTGAVVKIGDGEYLEIWVTTANAYYDLTANYSRVV